MSGGTFQTVVRLLWFADGVFLGYVWGNFFGRRAVLKKYQKFSDAVRVELSGIKAELFAILNPKPDAKPDKKYIN